MKIAHLSDVHVLALPAATLPRLLNKRLTGYVNLKLRRQAAHQRRLARAVLAEVRRREVDHVVITGDLAYLSLPEEFAAAQQLLEQELGSDPEWVSLVPGNHDAYTRGAHRQGLFLQHFAPYTTSDLPDATSLAEPPRYPYVRLRGPVAIIGLSTALPRPPLVAAGELGLAQRVALHGLLAHAEVRRRMPVLLQHHPLHQVRSKPKAWMSGLADASEQAALLADLPRGVLLHGHLHQRVRHTLRTSSGQLHAIGAPSASLLDPRPDRMAGFNLYHFAPDDGALVEVSSFRVNPDGTAVERAPIPWGSRSVGPGP